MSIDLTLDRIRLLSSKLPSFNRPTFHIAGTNGKGSVAAVISSILRAAEPPLSVGRFTSPHLIEPRDSISINGEAISSAAFGHATSAVRRVDQLHGTQLTSFELLTLAALSEFQRQEVDFVVLEVGLGGRLDATNSISDETIVLSILTSVDFDHQAFLGTTIEAITREKCGIARRGKPFLLGPQVHHTQVEAAVREATSSIGAPLLTTCRASYLPNDPNPHVTFLHDFFSPRRVLFSVPCFPEDIITTLPLQGDHQLQNAAVAASAISAMLSHPSCMHLGMRDRISPTSMCVGISTSSWPGRLSYHKVSSLAGTSIARSPLDTLVDGAHNPGSSAALSSFISKFISDVLAIDDQSQLNLVYILALSHSPPKTPSQTIAPLLPPTVSASCQHRMSVNVAFVEFSQPTGMPWVKATPIPDVKAAVEALDSSHILKLWIPEDGLSPTEQIIGAFQWAAKRFGEQSKTMPTVNLVVLAGSLYLVGDFYRMAGL